MESRVINSPSLNDNQIMVPVPGQHVKVAMLTITRQFKFDAAHRLFLKTLTAEMAGQP